MPNTDPHLKVVDQENGRPKSCDERWGDRIEKITERSAKRITPTWQLITIIIACVGAISATAVWAAGLSSKSYVDAKVDPVVKDQIQIREAIHGVDDKLDLVLNHFSIDRNQHTARLQSVPGVDSTPPALPATSAKDGGTR